MAERRKHYSKSKNITPCGNFQFTTQIKAKEVHINQPSNYYNLFSCYIFLTYQSFMQHCNKVVYTVCQELIYYYDTTQSSFMGGPPPMPSPVLP